VAGAAVDGDEDGDEEDGDEDPEDGDVSVAGLASVLVSAGVSFFLSPLPGGVRESLR
jgi:hypothetical protein